MLPIIYNVADNMLHIHPDYYNQRRTKENFYVGSKISEKGHSG